jgi:hypothetical protein
MNYTDEVSLYFGHDVSQVFKGQSFEFASYGLDYLVFDRINNRIVKAVDHNLEKKIDKITIKQFSYHFTISETLNILLYSIINTE